MELSFLCAFSRMMIMITPLYSWSQVVEYEWCAKYENYSEGKNTFICCEGFHDCFFDMLKMLCKSVFIWAKYNKCCILLWTLGQGYRFLIQKAHDFMQSAASCFFTINLISTLLLIQAKLEELVNSFGWSNLSPCDFYGSHFWWEKMFQLWTGAKFNEQSAMNILKKFSRRNEKNG